MILYFNFQEVFNEANFDVTAKKEDHLWVY